MRESNYALLLTPHVEMCSCVYGFLHVPWFCPQTKFIHLGGSIKVRTLSHLLY